MSKKSHSGLRQLLTADDVKHIETCIHAGARSRHLAWSIVNAEDQSIDYTRKKSDYETNNAVDLIANTGHSSKWLDEKKSEVVSCNFDETAAALAEIRCYGALLRCGFDCHPIQVTSQPTPDFKVNCGQDIFYVEVNAKLEHEDQTNQQALLAQGGLPDGASQTRKTVGTREIITTVSEQHPFGRPDPEKAGDSTQANAISRICAIKQSEHQAVSDAVNVLWIDLRSLGSWPQMLKVDQCAPLLIWQGEALTSGAIWYAFYGWKGAPIFTDTRPWDSPVTMGHHGRFSLHHDDKTKSNFSAAVLCLEGSTVVFENPLATNPLTVETKVKLASLPDFDFHHSAIDWSVGQLSNRIGYGRALIETMSASRSTE